MYIRVTIGVNKNEKREKQIVKTRNVDIEHQEKTNQIKSVSISLSL